MFIHNIPAAFYGRGLKITSDILEKWYLEFDNNIQEFQKYLLEQTFENPLFASWSLRVRYREILLKTIITWLEKQQNCEVNSRWYELIADFASHELCEQEWCHTIFILDNNQFVIHRQSTALLSHGLTGLSSWPASICLGDYLMNNKQITIQELDWNHYSTETINSDTYDMVLAADVVYDPSVIENLVKTIRILLQNNKASCAYIANAIRNESTYEQFRATLRK
ncbi:hypothetical protein I4U23_002216 [Adineta vaga]|nr:hypothetical protein I4U23_002216 [Adineta vaga]